MPDITTSTATEQYTIAGKTFNVYQPYAEGHVLTANEAASLNQTFAENIRNNFAAKVKEQDEAGSFDQDTAQSQLNDYMTEYEFGQRRGGGGRVSDPVEARALEIAKDKVREALKGEGYKLSDVATSEITRLAKEVLDNYPAIRETARQIVEAANSLVVNVGSVAPKEEAPAETSKGKKAAAE
jgi:hypothetical protein